jgi:integrase
MIDNRRISGVASSTAQDGPAIIDIVAYPKGHPTMIHIAAPADNVRAINATHLTALVQSFLETKRQTLSAKSYTNYVIDLAPFLQWWEMQSEPVLTQAGFSAFVAWLRYEWRNSFGKPATAQVMWRVCKRLRQVLDWGHVNGYIPVSVSGMVPILPEMTKLKYFPEPDEIYELVMAADGDTRLRDASIITLLVATGARRFELAEVEVSDVEFFTPTTNLTVGADHGGFVHLRKTKGDRDGAGAGRLSVFDGVAGLLLKVYLRAIGRRRGRLYGMTDTNIRNIVHQLGIVSDLPRMHPHAFRSAFVDHWSDTNAVAGEMAMIALRLQIGHALSSDVTNRYRDLANPTKNVRRIRQFYTSPLLTLGWRWEDWPVHIAISEPNANPG